MSLPKITSAMLIVTHSCNLACRYCFVHKEPQYMTLETAKAAAMMLEENCGAGEVPEINFFGGEPTLAWYSIIGPLTTWIKRKGTPFRLSMTSNGILLDKEKREFMKDNKIGLLLSVDGAKATQDYNRPFPDGRGSFDILSPHIEAIARDFPGTVFRMTAIPETAGNMFENILFAESCGFKSFFIVPDNFQPWTAAAKKKLKKELEKYTDYYIHRYRNQRPPISFSTFEEALQDIRRINAAQGHREALKCKAEGKCGLGSGKFASIHPDGSIYGCQEMTSNEGRESPFWIGSLSEGVSEERRRALMGMYCGEKVKGGKCRSCKYDNICDGGCVANNYLVTGDINTMPAIQCWWKQAVLDEAIRAMTVLGEEQNEAFKAHWEDRA